MRLILDVSEGSVFFMSNNFEDEGTTIHRNFETVPSGRALHPRTLGTAAVSLREHEILQLYLSFNYRTNFTQVYQNPQNKLTYKM